jgi:hypothetical protein
VERQVLNPQRSQPGVERRARPWCVSVVVAILGLSGSQVAKADECVWVGGAQIFSSQNGRQGFKVTMGGSPTTRVGGRLFTFDTDGRERLIWQSRLVNVPVGSYVADDGPTVVTIDTACRMGYEHSIVVYGANGKVVVDYRLEDFLTSDEIDNRVPRSVSSRRWAEGAQFHFDQISN